MKQIVIKKLAVWSLTALLPSLLLAQEVDRKLYPDFTWRLNPDPTLMMVRKAPEAQRAAAVRPSHVNNAELKFFPPVFNQDGGSCGSASRIRYMFTHELNAYRNLSGASDANSYPTHFVWLLTFGNSGKDEFVQFVGVPSAETYGGRTYSSLFGNQDAENNNFGWMNGYDKWYSGMFNRMQKPVNFTESVKTEAGREAVKNWLWNHNGDTDFHGGGICGIGVASGGDWQRIPSTPANDAAGVTGQYYVKRWGTNVDHALTIVGYDDRIEFDLNGNGVYGETSADEVGAWIIVNSWSDGWCNKGFIYCPYAHGGAWFNESGGTYTMADSWWYPEVYKVRKDYRPLRTIKLNMDYSHRSEICLSAGISTDLNATVPERTITFDHFKYAGDGNGGNTNPAPAIPMLGKWADGKLHTEPMEFGYDLTDLTAGFDKNLPLKYFFIVETRSWGQGSGHIYNASIIDYEFDTDGLETPFNLPTSGQTITSAGNKTIISTVVYGQGYYAPQNVSYNEGTLRWDAPITSGHDVTTYRIYKEGVKVAELPSEVTECALAEETDQVTYAVAAYYGSEAVESSKVSVNTPITTSALNNSIKLTNTGFSIPDLFASKFDKVTIEYWFKPSSLSDWNQSAGPGWGTFMFHANANGAFTAGWDTSNRVNGNSGNLKSNTWAHVAMVVDGNVFTTYINGVKSGSVTSSTYSGVGGFGDLVFSSSSGSAWNGYIDEIRIWNYARTADQIKNDKNIVYSGTNMPAGLLAYYRGTLMESDGVQKMRDYVGGHHAPLANSNSVTVSTSGQPLLQVPSEALSATINAPAKVYAGLPADFSATCSASAARLCWTAPDAGVQNLFASSPSLTFTHTGNQQVTLVAYNAAGELVTTTSTVNVQAAPAADATFTVTKAEIPAGDRVTFMANSPQLGYIYEWSMPGAVVETASTPTATATYPQKGTYTVTLKVSAPGGTAKTSTQTIHVVEVAPQSAFSLSPSVVIKGETLFLKDESRYAPTRWQWQLHSPAKDYVVMGQNSSLRPDVPGVYDLSLTTTNAAGSHTATRERALVVCNADSKNGLNFGNSGASVTATGNLLTAGSKEFTVEWWMNPDHNATYSNGLGDETGTMIVRTDANGALSLTMNGKTSTTSSGTVLTGEWHHYAVVYSSGRYAYYYRDGVQIAKKAQGATSLSSALQRFVIGGLDAPVYGSMDEVRVWNKALSVEQIRQYANSPITDIAAAEADGLVLYYDFNQSGGDVEDRSSHRYNGSRSGFGPDGDAWGLSRGVFCLNFEEAAQPEDITYDYLSNYKKSFTYDASKQVNTNVANRFYAIKDWKTAGASVSGSVTTGVHVDVNKESCFTVTTQWDGFGTLADHTVWQNITLPAGSYVFTATYDDKYEGQCENSYLVVAEGANSLPNTANLAADALAYAPMSEKGVVSENSLSFVLTRETTISLGMLINMSGKSCLCIKQFSLTRNPVTVIEADNQDGYDLTVDGTGYTTLYLPYNTEIPGDVRAYTVTDVEGRVLMMEEITDGVLPANTGVVIQAAPGIYHFTPVASAGTAHSILVGVTAAASPMAGRKYYQLGMDGEFVGFYPFTGSKLTPYAAYLQRSADDEVEFYITDTFPTALEKIIVPGQGTTDTYYDLSGRRVSHPRRGVYIKGGKKVYVR